VAATGDSGPTAAKRRRVVYDRLAPGYDGFMRPLERWYLARLRKAALAGLPEGARLLEVGAGTGLNFPFYPRAVALGVASELSSAMIGLASAKQKAGHVHLVQNSAERLPFRDASFDAAFATLVFCSVASPREAFAELRRVVRPGGNITLLEHVRPDGMLLGRLFDALSILTVAVFDDHFNRRTAEEARRAGLQTVRVRKYAFGVIQLIECRV
jgi:phosphatidylethanolamine/phosphatidyl-N-methylethanolamine N-methyltransferase